MRVKSAIGMSMLSAIMGGIPVSGGVSYKNDHVAYRPKRQKFKGWQRQLREHK